MMIDEEARAGSEITEAAVRIDARGGLKEVHEFVGAPGGRILCSCHMPLRATSAGAVVCPSIRSEFETNYRREIVLARALAARGIAVLRFQYLGTGNSEGASDIVTLETMEDDALTATQHLEQVAGVERLAFVGTRVGGTIAARLAARRPGAPLVLWEPVGDVKREFRKIFRARRFWAAKDEAEGELAGERAIDELARSGVVDVMGHPIHRRLYESAISSRIEEEVVGAPRDVLIVRLGAREAIASRYEALASKWRDAGLQVQYEVVDEQESWWLEPPGERQDKRVLVASPAVDVTSEWLVARMCAGETTAS